MWEYGNTVSACNSCGGCLMWGHGETVSAWDS